MSTSNPPDSRNPVRKFYSPIEEALRAADDELAARQEELQRAQHSGEVVGGDRKLDSSQQHNWDGDAAARKKNFDQKVYYFPESFNALRREMEQYWPTLFTAVNPEIGKSIAYCMVFDAPQFVALMNEALDLTVQMDSDNVDGICKQFLDALRVLRGVSRLN